MVDKPVRYASIQEVRSSFYPTSAGMLSLEREDVVELPRSLVERPQQALEEMTGTSNSEEDD